MASAELKTVLDTETSMFAKSDGSSPSVGGNKRKRDDNDNLQSDAKNNTNNSNNDRSNKRQKKKKGGGGKKKKSAQHSHNKQKRNWIESCSESVSRLPSNCAAPVTCVITRSEIEEEPLLPKQCNDVTQGENTKHALANKEDDDNAPADPDISINELQDDNVSPIDHSVPNIATLSKTCADSFTKEAKQPWKIATTINIDGEEKKIFIPVKRHASACGPSKWQQKQKKQGKKKQHQNYVHLPDGDNGDGKKNPFPKEAVPDKFWAQRKRLFSRYDEGIQIGGESDPEMWYSITPESIALHIANRMVSMMKRNRCDKGVDVFWIIDVFSGCGGNSIAFARLNRDKDLVDSHARVKVIAVDNNLSRLKMAATNASIYQIDKDDIVFVHADAIEVVNAYEEGSRKRVVSQTSTVDAFGKSYHGYTLGGIGLLPDHVNALFLSPPWGGLTYNMPGKKGNAGFDPVTGITLESRTGDEDSDVIKTNGGELLNMSAKAVLNESKKEGLIAVFLPRNIDGVQFTRTAVTSNVKGSIELEQNHVNGKVKTVTAYIGSCVNEHLSGEE